MTEVTETYGDDDESQIALMNRIEQEEATGNDDAVKQLMTQLLIPAKALMVAKKTMGAAWIRENGYRTDEADREYGNGWLDR